MNSVAPLASATHATAQKPKVVLVEDVQNRADTRQIPINRVGIKEIVHPVKVRDRSSGDQHTVATLNMYVNLPHNFKGTHMSRFVEILNSHEREISVENFPTMLRDMVAKLEAVTGHIEMNFPYFINKTAPISGVQSLMDYDVTFIGDICSGEHHALRQGSEDLRRVIRADEHVDVDVPGATGLGGGIGQGEGAAERGDLTALPPLRRVHAVEPDPLVRQVLAGAVGRLESLAAANQAEPSA